MRIVVICIVLGMLSLSGEQSRAQVYRCEQTDGVVSFQQTPCEEAKEEKVLDMPIHPTWRDRESALIRKEAFERQQRQPNVEHYLREAEASSPQIDSYFDASEASRDSFRSATQNSSSPCPPGQVPLNPSRLNPRRGWDPSRGYVELHCREPGATSQTRMEEAISSPTQIDPPDVFDHRNQSSIRRVAPVQSLSEMNQIRDTQGGWYNILPGTNTVRDRSTGQDCTVVQDTIRCN